MLRILGVHTVPGGKGSTWLQVFFDLVYVAILIELGNRLSHNITLEGALEFALLFILIWWPWLEFVMYGRYFPVDGVGQRILTVLYMAFLLAMAFEIHDITAGTAAAFVIFNGLSKFVLALMYARAWARHPEYRAMTSHYTAAYAVVGLLWVTIGLFAPTNFWLWSIVMLIGIMSPLIIRLVHKLTGRTEQPQPATKHHFLLHRFGELTIIVLGEFFIKLVTTAEDRELTTLNIYVGLCLLGISISLWWLYFDHLEHSSLANKGTRPAVWIYSHYPFLLGITAYGVMGTKLFAATRGEPFDDQKRILFTFSLALALLSYAAIERALKENSGPLTRHSQPWLRIGGAAALIGVGIFGSPLNVEILATFVVTVFLVQVLLDVRMRLQNPEREAANNITTS